MQIDYICQRIKLVSNLKSKGMGTKQTKKTETKPKEKNIDDAPLGYSNNEASAWVSGYNTAIENTNTDILEALIKANEELKSVISILDGRMSPEFIKTDLGMRLASFFKANAFICEDIIQPIINKATK